MNSNRPLWRPEEIRDIFGCENFDVGIGGISIDSRSTVQDDLFIALSGDPGPRFGGGNLDALDGHDFIGSALEKGAASVMVHRDLECSVASILVENTLDGLWQLGAAARKRCSAKIVAITGSSGKTTMRYWLESVLQSIAPTHASVGSLNNHWGLPLSLSRMPSRCAYGVFEIGTNHVGEIAPLAELASPDIALVLNVLPAHIGNFEDMVALRTEKLSISRGLVEDGGILILPVELAEFANHRHIITFGISADADVSATSRVQNESTLLDIDVCGEKIECRVPFVGKERVDSILALFAVLKALDIKPSISAQRVGLLELPEGRGNRATVGGIIVVDDSYNANPVSMAMSLTALQQSGSGKKIALLGEMLELGETSLDAHRQISRLCMDLDEVISFGEGFEGVSFECDHRHIGDVAVFDLDEFSQHLSPGDTVLVKGSNKVFWKHGFVNDLIKLLAR